MKVPNYMNSIVEDKKLVEYLLSFTHPHGKHKAMVFQQWGYTQSNSNEFKKQLLKIVHTRKIIQTKKLAFGVNYEVHGKIRSRNGQFKKIVTIWTIETGNKTSRLVSAYPM